jgi:hypothetical protein
MPFPVPESAAWVCGSLFAFRLRRLRRAPSHSCAGACSWHGSPAFWFLSRRPLFCARAFSRDLVQLRSCQFHVFSRALSVRHAGWQRCGSGESLALPPSGSAPIPDLFSLDGMKRPLRLTLAFLWLTVGYWIFSFVLQYALILMPFAHSGSGISTSGGDGVNTVHFSGTPGDAVLVLVSSSGEKDINFPSTRHINSSSNSTSMAWGNGLLQLFFVMAYALVSLPILSKLLRREPSNRAMEPTASRRTIQLCMSSNHQSAATRAPARGTSSCSR